jgi:predicted anti-sigma-YlaC factor YlaD
MLETSIHDPCERARRALSLEVDGELADFGRKALRRHLLRCGACLAAQEHLVNLTTAIRMLPTVEPSLSVSLDVSTSRTGSVSAKKRVSAGISVCVAAACATVALTGGAPAGGVTSGEVRLEHRLAFAQVQHLRAERDLTRS